MTVSVTTSRVEYYGDGSTKTFSVPFYFLDDGDLKVYKAGVLQTLTTNYTVSGDGSPSGGSITFVTAPTSAQPVVIFRDPELLQNVDYVENDPFPAEAQERALDRLTMIAQRNRDLLDRALLLADGEAGTLDMALPDVDLRKNKTFYWNADGEPYVADVSAATVSFTPITETFDGDGATLLFNLSEDPGSASALVVSVDGVAQIPGIDFDVSGTDITFSVAPGVGVDNICVQNFGVAKAVDTDALRDDLANAISVDVGDALIGVKRTATGASSETQHNKNERSTFYVEEFGAIGDNTTDDGEAFRAAAEAARVAGGGFVRCSRGKTYRLVAGGTAVYGANYCVLLDHNVKLDLNGATLNCEVGTGNQCAVWVYGNNAEINLNGGRINAVSSGTPSSSYFFHAAVSVGIFNNSGDTVASPSQGQTITGWSVHGGTLHTTRSRCPVVQGMGGINGGRVYDIKIPDSSTCSGIHFDWGNVGAVSSADIPTTKTTFLAGNCYTTHPHNIKIENLTIGALSVTVSGDLGASGIRLSGCYGIEIDGVDAESLTLAGYLHTGGDLGFEFAPSATKPLAYKDNSCKRMRVRNPSTLSYGVFVDTLADNVYREQYISGYTPIQNPMYHGSITIDECTFIGPNSSSKYGARIIQARGVRIKNTSFKKWDVGVWADEFASDVDIDDNNISECVSHGVRVGFAELREGTERIGVRRNKIYGNGTGGTGYGIYVPRCRNAWIDDNVLGTVDEASQDMGIFVSDSAVNYNINVRRNHVLGATSAAMSIGGSIAPYYYGQIGEFASNTAEPSCPQQIIVSQSLIPHRSMMQVNRWAREYINNGLSTPTDGHWYRGSVIWQRSPVAAGTAITSVVTSGTFGTLSGLTNGETTNGSKDITCSLSGITADTIANTYTVTVSSATNLRVGLSVSISAAGITNARIINIVGTTVYLDAQAKSTQIGATFTTAGVIDGEVISINTTTPISSAIVMKINGATVTLDTAASDTQTGRTLSYTTPVFKNHANIAA